MRCRECEDDVDTLVTVQVEQRRVRMCEECADRLREEGEIAEVAQVVMRDMMGNRRRW